MITEKSKQGNLRANAMVKRWVAEKRVENYENCVHAHTNTYTHTESDSLRCLSKRVEKQIKAIETERSKNGKK